MSAVRDVVANGRVYRVIEDCSLRYSVLLLGRAIDENTGAPLQQPFSLSVDADVLQAKAGRDGLFGVSGYPERIASALPMAVNIELRSAQFRNFTFPAVIPAGPTYPINLGDVVLRGVPVRVQGRVSDDATRVPLVGATVVCDTATINILRTPLHVSHAAGTTLRRRTLPASGAPRQLAEPAAFGAIEVTLDNTAGLGATALLRFGDDLDADFGVVAASLSGNRLRLETPLARSFPVNTVVQRHNRGAVGATTTLTRAADAGDGALIGTASLTPGSFELVDGATTEYGFFSVLTDAQGDYRIDGLAGVRTLTLRASAGGFPDRQILVAVRYDEPVNYIDFRL